MARSIKRLWISLLTGANIATILLLWACCLSTWVDPTIHPRLSQAGLLFPVLLILNMLFVIPWFLTSLKGLLLPMAGILVCTSFIRDYYPINLHCEPPKDAIKVLSYNVMYYGTVDSIYGDSDTTQDYIFGSQADIITLIESEPYGRISERMNMYTDSLKYNIKSQGTLQILSKYPFVGEKPVFESDEFGNELLAWKVAIDQDTVLVVACHLQSNGISEEEKNLYSNAIISDSRNQLKESGKLILSRLSNAVGSRAKQTRFLCDQIELSECKSVILAGDFNDTPVSYVYQQIDKHLKSCYRESGNGAGLSFNKLGFPVHIDHIFVSDDWKSYDTHIDRSIHTSDHYPIVTYLTKTAK